MSLISRDPDILGGKPVISGTRISVELILSELAAGLSVEELIELYPKLTRAQVLAALGFAVEVVRTESVRAAG